MNIRQSVVLIVVVVTLCYDNYCSAAAVLKAPKKESTFSSLLSRLHTRIKENARMDSTTTSRLWDSTGRILKALLKMATSSALKRRSGRLLTTEAEETNTEQSTQSFRSSRSSHRGRGKIALPSDDLDEFEMWLEGSPQSRSPKWPPAASSKKPYKNSAKGNKYSEKQKHSVKPNRNPVYENRNPVYDNRKPIHENRKPIYEKRKPIHENRNPIYESRKPIHEDRDQINDHRNQMNENRHHMKHNKNSAKHKTPSKHNKTPAKENKTPIKENKIPVKENKIPIKENKIPIKEIKSPMTIKEIKNSKKQNKVSIITKSSPPKYYGVANYGNSIANTGILESTSMIRSQPLIVELGPGITRDGRRLQTVEIQGVKIIVGEPKEQNYFSWPN